MKEITLQRYLESGHKQSDAAAIMGCNQSAISHMLKAGREIYFRLNKSGKVVSFYENKRPGKKRSA